MLRDFFSNSNWNNDNKTLNVVRITSGVLVFQRISQLSLFHGNILIKKNLSLKMILK